MYIYIYNIYIYIYNKFVITVKICHLSRTLGEVSLLTSRKVESKEPHSPIHMFRRIMTRNPVAG